MNEICRIVATHEGIGRYIIHLSRGKEERWIGFDKSDCNFDSVFSGKYFDKMHRVFFNERRVIEFMNTMSSGVYCWVRFDKIKWEERETFEYFHIDFDFMEELKNI